jgi:hypothetical protein
VKILQVIRAAKHAGMISDQHSKQKLGQETTAASGSLCHKGLGFNPALDIILLLFSIIIFFQLLLLFIVL